MKTRLGYPIALGAMLVSALMATGSPSVLMADGGSASAKPDSTCVRKGDAVGVTVNAKTINAKITSMLQANASHSEIESTLARDWCLTQISKGPSMALAASTGADVTWTGLTINYDNVTHYYYAYGNWHWNNSHYSSEADPGCQLASKADGGVDGVALRLSGGQYQIKTNGYTATTWGNSALDSYINDFTTATMNPSKVDQYGVGWTWQDNVRKMENSSRLCPGPYDLSTYAGSIVMGFVRLNGPCANTQVFGDYAHDWSTTSINGIGAAADGFSIQWTTTTNQWTKSAAGQTAPTC